MPCSTRALPICAGARLSFEQVKQWAKSAKARGGVSGRSSLAAKGTPRIPGNSILRLGIDAS